MALKYNLSKVYALSDNDPEFVKEILTLFVTEVPDDLLQVKEGIKKKDIKETFKSVKTQVSDAIKEIKKDFDL